MAKDGLSADMFGWALACACQMHRIPFDPSIVLRQFPPPHTVESLREALAALGLRSGIAAEDIDTLSAIPGPLFLVLRSAADAEIASGRPRDTAAGEPGVANDDSKAANSPVSLALLLARDGVPPLLLEVSAQ